MPQEAEASAIEGVPDPLQWRGFAMAYGYDIETTGMFGPALLLLQKLLSGGDQLVSLAPVDAFDRAAPCGVLAVAHFGEYYCIAIEHDQIEFAALTAPVLGDGRQPVSLEVLTGEGFRFPPAGMSRIIAQSGTSGRRWT